MPKTLPTLSRTPQLQSQNDGLSRWTFPFDGGEADGGNGHEPLLSISLSSSILVKATLTTDSSEYPDLVIERENLRYYWTGIGREDVQPYIQAARDYAMSHYGYRDDEIPYAVADCLQTALNVLKPPPSIPLHPRLAA